VPPEGRVLREAGVLIGVIAGARPQVLLTKRASGLKHHPGQIAFPGGKVDPADDGAGGSGAARGGGGDRAATRRGRGSGHASAARDGDRLSRDAGSGLDQGPSFAPVPETGEVAEAFAVPFDHVTDPARFVIEARIWRGTRRHYYAVPWGPYYIWGATARMLRVLADRMQA
jgi:hypothetical protein